MCVSLSLDDIVVQFPPEEVSASFQSRVRVFVTISMVAVTSDRVFWKQSTVCETANKNISRNVWEEKC